MHVKTFQKYKKVCGKNISILPPWPPASRFLCPEAAVFTSYPSGIVSALLSFLFFHTSGLVLYMLLYNLVLTPWQFTLAHT